MPRGTKKTPQKVTINNQHQLQQLVLQWGFLPFFRNSIEGFSVEELTPETLWFNKDVDGPWEWKGPIIVDWQCTYGKFFAGKAGFISMQWLPKFLLWRRSQHPLSTIDNDARHILQVLRDNESLLSQELKKQSGYSLARRSTQHTPFGDKKLVKTGAECDKHIVTLQMATYVCIANFEYKYDRKGQPYGWGVARYCTPEAMYPDLINYDAIDNAEGMKARQKIIEHIAALFPNATTQQIEKLI